jgi:transposase
MRQPKSLRTKSEKKSGGQEGHRGTTLRFCEKPDEVIEHRVSVCMCCQHDLREVEAGVMPRRQVVDIPSPQLLVQEHHAKQKQCPRCQQMTVASFPSAMTAPIQYGSRIGAVAVYLSQQQLLPLERTCEVLSDM